MVLNYCGVNGFHVSFYCVLIYCMSLQSSIESVVANSFVPSDFLVDGQVSGLGTVHPLLTLNFFSAWIFLLFKRKSSSSVMDGLQRRREEDWR